MSSASDSEIGFYLGFGCAAFLWATISLTDGADVTASQLAISEKLCAVNGGIEAVDRENAFCENGARFKLPSWVEITRQ